MKVTLDSEDIAKALKDYFESSGITIPLSKSIGFFGDGEPLEGINLTAEVELKE